MAHAYYYVNGIVEFTYTSTQRKVGDTTSTSRMWTEHYGANLGASVLDPRFLQLNAGVNYSVNHTNRTPSTDITMYNINASFFPGRMISWTLYDMKSIINVPTSGSIAGYDIETTSYGGSMNFHLTNLLKRNGGNTNNYYNRNNNNNNNNSGVRFRIPLPDITLTANHTEAISMDSLRPQNETRDYSSALIYLRPVSEMDLRLEGRTEKFEDVLSGSNYELTTMDALSSIKLGPRTDLGLEGRWSERQYDNAMGSSSDQGVSYQVKLDRRENPRLSHSYRYGYSNYHASGSEATTQSSDANVQYRILPELNFNAGMMYSEIEYFRPATPTTLEERSSIKSGSLTLGVQYSKEYRPEFLDPFILRTSYGLTSGFTDVNDSTSGVAGNGRYYGNTAGLGLFSSGWRYETLSMEYTYDNKRDHSPLHANSNSQKYTLTAATSRIPQSNFRANLQYSVIESRIAVASIGPIVTLDAKAQESRALTFRLSFDHAVTSWMTFVASASQQKTTTTTNYTLATIALPGTPEVTYRHYNAALNASYPLSRNLHLRGSAGYDLQQQLPNGSDTTTYSQSAGLDWRMRQIFFNADYRWREDIPQNSLRTQEKAVYLRVSRPF